MGPPRFFTPGQEPEILRLHQQDGLSAEAIARRYGCNGWTVRQVLKRHGVKLSLRHYAVNENALDNAAADPRVAYAVGLWMADGCVHKTRKGHRVIILTLAERDHAHVEWVRDLLGSSHPVLVRKNPGGVLIRRKYKCQRISYLSICSSLLGDALGRYGVVPRKSKIAKVRVLENNRYFWCGAICGDGSIGIYRQLPTIGLVGSQNLVRQFVAYTKSVCGHGCHARRKERSLWAVQIAGRAACFLIRHLFGASPFALPRKLSIAERIDQQCDGQGHLRPEFGGPEGRRGRRPRACERARPDMAHLLCLKAQLGSWSAVATHLGLPSLYGFPALAEK